MEIALAHCEDEENEEVMMEVRKRKGRLLRLIQGLGRTAALTQDSPLKRVATAPT